VHGSVGAAEPSAVLGSAAALLHPIHLDEPFGLSVVEAISAAVERGFGIDRVVDGCLPV
jgi:glycosyltransferase involved in cell wall biosynthesis